MTHALLTGDQDPPGEWSDGWIGGGYVSFKRPTTGDKEHHVVVEQGGEYGDGAEARPVEVWTVTIHENRILMNWKGASDAVGEGIGMSEGAEIALEYMKESRVDND